jgi:hypothetical protein
MTKVHEAFPSKYLKAADLSGREVPVTIARVEREKVGDDEKFCVYFVGKQKPLVLNRTNADSLAMLLGSDDFDDWPEGQVILYGTPVSFRGQSTLAIRIKAVPRRKLTEVEPPPNLGEHLNDEIPF